METTVINKAAKNEMIDLREFINGVMKYTIKNQELIGTFSIMFKHPDTGNLHMVSRVAINQDTKNIIIS